MFKKLALAISFVSVMCATPALAQGAFFDSFDGGNFNFGSNGPSGSLFGGGNNVRFGPNGAGGSFNTDFGRIRLDTNGNFGFNGDGFNFNGNFGNGNGNFNFGGYGDYFGMGDRSDYYPIPPSPGLISAFQSQGDTGDFGRSSFKTGQGPNSMTEYFSNPTMTQSTTMLPTGLGGLAPCFGLGSGYRPDFMFGGSPIPIPGLPGFGPGFNFGNGNGNFGFNNGTFSGSYNGVGGTFNPGSGNFNIGGSLPGGMPGGFNVGGNVNNFGGGGLGGFFP